MESGAEIGKEVQGVAGAVHQGRFRAEDGGLSNAGGMGQVAGAPLEVVVDIESEIVASQTQCQFQTRGEDELLLGPQEQVALHDIGIDEGGIRRWRSGLFHKPTSALSARRPPPIAVWARYGPQW